MEKGEKKREKIEKKGERKIHEEKINRKDGGEEEKEMGKWK